MDESKNKKENKKQNKKENEKENRKRKEEKMTLRSRSNTKNQQKRKVFWQITQRVSPCSFVVFILFGFLLSSGPRDGSPYSFDATRTLNFLLMLDTLWESRCPAMKMQEKKVKMNDGFLR